MTVYASTKYAVEGLSDGLRRALLPWGITVISIHPSSVSGTEFNQRSARPGKVEFRPNPIGRISRERLARHVVALIEKPQRALFISRLYDLPVMLNKLFPGLVDLISKSWVRSKRKKEVPPEDAVTPVRYSGSFSFAPWVGGLVALGLITRLWLKKS
jgi:short-subunit dehydrogenase